MQLRPLPSQARSQRCAGIYGWTTRASGTRRAKSLDHRTYSTWEGRYYGRSGTIALQLPTIILTMLVLTSQTTTTRFSNDIRTRSLANFSATVTRYLQVWGVLEVVALFTAHATALSQDQFEIAYSDYSYQTAANAIAAALIVSLLCISTAYHWLVRSRHLHWRPRVSPFHRATIHWFVFDSPLLGGNPAFKLYDVDPDTFGIMDVHVIFSML